MSTDPSPIAFSLWLRHAQAALAEEQPAEAPCGDCNACCRTSHVIHVRTEEKRTRSRIPRRFLLPAPGLPPGNLVLGYDQAGCCPLLVGGRCSIYEDRPLACRTYDCRIYAAAGIAADRVEIARQVERWRFAYASQDDRDRHAAVKAAAGYIRRHSECLASEAARHDPLRAAVLAIAVHEMFLQPGTRVSGREPSGHAIARAVVAANEKLFGDW
jgi:Fe-S-cluster containining protein